MKKFRCDYCVNTGKAYYCYRYNWKKYYLCLCDNHLYYVLSYDEEITYEEFIAAKAMEAL